MNIKICATNFFYIFIVLIINKEQNEENSAFICYDSNNSYIISSGWIFLWNELEW